MVRTITCKECDKQIKINEPGFVSYFDDPITWLALLAHYLLRHRRWILGPAKTVKLVAATIYALIVLVGYGVLWVITWPLWKLHEWMTGR